MGKIEIKTIGRTGYEAKAFFEDNNVTVLKGSKLSNKFSGNLSNKIAKLREQKDLVSEDNILLQDISSYRVLPNLLHVQFHALISSVLLIFQNRN